MTDAAWIKVANVQRVKGKEGRVHLYYRKGSHREGPLVSADGTQALADEVAAITTRVVKINASATKPQTGSVGGMLAVYERSAEFISLARSTQSNYRDIIKELTADVGDVLLGEVSRSWVIALRDAWAVRGYRAANQRVQVLKNALSPAIDDESDTRINSDPFHKVKKVKRPHDAGEAHPIWDDAEVETAINDAIARGTPGLARAIALGRYGGFRRGTICAIPLNARSVVPDADGALENRIVWITEKRKVLADKREDQRLTAVLVRTANKAMTIAYNADGGAWKERQLHQAVERLLVRLAKAGRIRATVDEAGVVTCPLTIHGLRHSRGVELAMAGSSDGEIMSQLEHSTPRAAQIYRRQADRRKMADASQDRVDRVVNLRDARAKAKSAEAR